MRLALIAAASLVTSGLAEVRSAPRYSFTRIAGQDGEWGSDDGSEHVSRFARPGSIAVDNASNVYVADMANSTVRKISSIDGTVTTLAGMAGQTGDHDGVGGGARFNVIGAIDVDDRGVVYVADLLNYRIRKITPEGVVTTLAGSTQGTRDGVGAAAQFGWIWNLSVDAEGNVYVCQNEENAVRKITPQGVVSTISNGLPKLPGSVGSVERFWVPSDIIVDRSGDLFVAARVGMVGELPRFGVCRLTPDGRILRVDKVPHSTGEVPTEGALSQFEAISGMARDVNGTIFVTDPVSGTIGRISRQGEVSRLEFNPEQSGLDGFSRLRGLAVDSMGNIYVSDWGRHTIYKGIAVRAREDARLSALSVRSRVATGDATLIMGFAVGGADVHDVMVRGLGPTLTDSGLVDVVRDPKLEVFRRGERMAGNDDWSEELTPVFARLGAGSPRQGSKDAALLLSVPPGSYTAHVISPENDRGVALAEVYDAGIAGAGKLRAVAVRSHAGVGADTLIAGFVIEGNGPKTVLVRGAGPSLAGAGVNGVLSDPRLRLFRGGVEIDANDDWGGTAVLKEAFGRVGAGSLESDTSKDAALLVSLEPGVYTAHVSGSDGGTGVALVEVYEME